MLRTIFALGNTPMIFNSLIPKSVDEITPEIRAKFRHYTTLYKEVFRPHASHLAGLPPCAG